MRSIVIGAALFAAGLFVGVAGAATRNIPNPDSPFPFKSCHGPCPEPRQLPRDIDPGRGHAPIGMVDGYLDMAANGRDGQYSISLYSRSGDVVETIYLPSGNYTIHTCSHVDPSVVKECPPKRQHAKR